VDDLPLAKARSKDPTRIAIAPQEYAFASRFDGGRKPLLLRLRFWTERSRHKRKRVESSIAATQLASHRGVRAQHLPAYSSAG